MEKYGERLVCVRYRYDRNRKVRVTTVELIESESPWLEHVSRIPANKIVNLRIVYGEVQLSRLVKAAGGRWNRAKKLWELQYKEVVELGLEDRMVVEVTKPV